MRDIDDTLPRLRELLERMQSRQANSQGFTGVMDRKEGRALSLAITKLEETIMWLQEAGS